MKTKILSFVSVAVFLFLFGWIYSRQGVLRLAAIEIDLEENTSLENDIKKQLVPYLGANLLTLSMADIQRKLQSDLRVKKVFISRKLPSTISLKIIPRTLVARVQTKKGPAWVTDDGSVSSRVDPGGPVPEWLNFKSCSNECLIAVSSWLAEVKVKEPAKFQKISQIKWLSNRGLLLHVDTKNQNSTVIEIELGTSNFSEKWKRVSLVVDLISEQKIQGERLMALGEGQVVITGVKNLHNLKNELNLKERVRRATQRGDARALAR